MDRQQVAIILAIVGFVVAAVILFRPTNENNNYGDNNANFPEGTLWLCGDAACGHSFNLTMKELGQHHEKHYGEPVPCAKCNKPAARANLCPHCKQVSVQERGGGACPKCGKAIE